MLPKTKFRIYIFFELETLLNKRIKLYCSFFQKKKKECFSECFISSKKTTYFLTGFSNVAAFLYVWWQYQTKLLPMDLWRALFHNNHIDFYLMVLVILSKSLRGGYCTKGVVIALRGWLLYHILVNGLWIGSSIVLLCE